MIAAEGQRPPIFDWAQEEDLSSSEHHNPSRFFRAAGRIAACTLLSLGAGVASTSVDSTETDLGPHRVEIRTSLDGEVDVDLGPVGSIALPLETTVGLDVEVKEYTGAGTDPDPESFTEEDLAPYIRFFSSPDASVRHAAKDVANTAARNALLTGVGLTAYEVQRRRKATEKATDPARSARKAWRGLAAVTLLPAVACNYGVSTSPEATDAVQLGAPYDGTPLEGAVVKGPLQAILGKYGEEALQRVRDNREFYEKVANNLEEAYENTLHMPGNGKTVVFATDLHCNIGMAQTAGKVVELYQAAMFASGGDDALSGTAPEGIICIGALGEAINSTEEVVSPGNHDSDIIEGYEREQGFQVMDGTVQEAAGIKILGDHDMRRSAMGTGIQPTGEQTPEELGDSLRDTACESDVDILLVHDPVVGQATAESGCVPLVLHGHTHKEAITHHANGTLQIVGESAGGVKPEHPTVDKPLEPAVLYAIRLDEHSNKPSFFQTITVNLDGSVDISNPTYVLDMPTGPEVQ